MRNENNTHVVLTEDFRTRETKQCLEAIRGLQTVIWVAEGPHYSGPKWETKGCLNYLD